MKTFSAILLLVTAASAAFGHEFSLEPDSFFLARGQRTALHLYVGESLKKDEERTYQAGKTDGFTLYSNYGTFDMRSLAEDGVAPLITIGGDRDGTYLLSMERNWSNITLDAAKFEDYLKEDGMEYVIAERKRLRESAKDGRERYRRYLKAILQVGSERIIVGIRKDLGVKYVFPEPTHGPGRENPFVAIREALDGLPEWPEGEFCADPFHWYYLSRNRRRDWSEVSKTIVSHMRHMPLHPMSPALKRIHTDKWEFETEGRSRRFSYREAARLQGFSKAYTSHGGDFVFPDADHPSPSVVYNQMRQRYKVVGNAVPPPLFEAVARALPDVWD